MERLNLGDRYEVQQQLSKKPGRQTYLAVDHQTQQQVVIKLLIFSYDFSWDDFKLFEREAGILKTLNHPAIPQYLDSFDLDLPTLKGFAFVQTYISAKSLEEHLQAHRTFSELEVKQIAKDILGVLVYLHEQSPPVIHRDLKPSNILLTDRSAHSAGQVYVVDFGSVQNSVFQEGGTWTITGTYGYAPPEQFSGRAIPTSDLYSLGATLIHLATGRHPADSVEHNVSSQSDQVNQATHLSPGLRRWLRRITELSPKRRFVSSREALQELEALQSENESAIDKPTSSKITLTKSAEELLIQVPPLSVRQKPDRPQLLEQARTSSLVPSFARSLPSPLFILFLILLGAYYGVVLLIMFLLPIIGWALLAGVSLCIFAAPFFLIGNYAKAQLRLVKGREQDSIVLSREFWGVKFHSISTVFQRNQVKLQHLPLKKIEQVSANQISNFSILPMLIIWIDTQEYRLTNLTPLELDWLSQEIQDWLNLPDEQVIE